MPHKAQNRVNINLGYYPRKCWRCI